MNNLERYKSLIDAERKGASLSPADYARMAQDRQCLDNAAPALYEALVEAQDKIKRLVLAQNRMPWLEYESFDATMLKINAALALAEGKEANHE